MAACRICKFRRPHIGPEMSSGRPLETAVFCVVLQTETSGLFRQELKYLYSLKFHDSLKTSKQANLFNYTDQVTTFVAVKLSTLGAVFLQRI